MTPKQKTELEKRLAATDLDRPARVIYAELFPDAVDYREFVDVLQGVMRDKKASDAKAVRKAAEEKASDEKTAEKPE